MFTTTVFVVVPKGDSSVPQIFGMELNGVDKCPLCGKRLEDTNSGGRKTEAINWPWHATIYQIKSGSFSYKCGGTLISGSAVITAGKRKIASRISLSKFFQLIVSSMVIKRSPKTIFKSA